MSASRDGALTLRDILNGGSERTEIEEMNQRLQKMPHRRIEQAEDDGIEYKEA
jgi:hypothetical protein